MPGGAPQRDSPETRAGSETPEATPDTPQRAAKGGTSPDGHNHDDDSFNAFMDSCRGDPHAGPTPAVPSAHPEPQRDQAEDAPLTVSRQAHLQRNYAALGQVTTEGDGQATASGAADRTADERGAPGEGARVEAATNTASEPIGPPPGTAPPWGRGHLDYALLERDASHPSEQAEHAANQDMGLWIPRPVAGEQLALAVSIRWVLSPRSRDLAEGTRTMADVTFGHRTGHTPPATMDQPGQWHYVATRLMAHTGAYSPNEMNGLHWQWYSAPPCASVRPCRTMVSGKSLDHLGTKDIPQATGGQDPRTSRSLPGRRHAETPWNARRVHHPGGVPPLAHTEAPCDRLPRGGARVVPTPQGLHSGTPKQRQETGNPGQSRRRSRTPPPAARRVVFHEDMDREHGGSCDPHARRPSSTTDTRRRSKRPRTERTHITTILTPVERERQAALHADSHHAAEEAPSRAVMSRLPSPRHEPQPGSGTHHRPRGRPTTRGPGAEGHTRGAPQPTNDEAEPPAPPTQPQREESTVGAEEMQGPRQRTPTSTQMGEPVGGTDRPPMQSADKPQEAAHRSDEALAAGQPGAEPKGPSPDTECEDGVR